MSFQIKRATRVGVRPLVCLYSESGCGKSLSSLYLARGFVGPNGKIGAADTESKRLSLYADVLPGGFDVVDFEPPFTPQRHIDLIDYIEQSGAQIGILDSGSHEWEGIGGVLEMAGDIETSSGRTGLHCWKKPKLEHQKFVLRLMQSSIPWIINLRSKYKSRQKKDNGKTVIVKDEFTTAIQADDFIFEMTVHGEIMPNHSFHLTKCSHPALKECFPVNAPIEIKHGEMLAKWCAGGGKVSQPASTPSTDLKRTGATEEQRERMLGQLCDKHGPDAVTEYAIAKSIIQPGQNLDDWPLSKVVTTKAEFVALDTSIEAWRKTL